MHASIRLAVATLAALTAAVPHRALADAKVVEITAHRFEFIPNQVTLQRGTPVVIKVRSQDVTHGFFNRALGIDAEIEPGKTTEVPITPAKPGRYTVICDHFCGAGHGNMKMTIVVE